MFPAPSDSPTFTVVISEKGGAERRESFAKAEITVGRVQGNELMLPKGNVSKKHARLLFRDGRFIVNDLNSTNGTYVNRRRISQATIVREGDRIYIGDFVLRIEVADGAMVESSSSARVERPTDDSVASSRPGDPVSHYPLERDPDESGSYPEVPVAPRVPSLPQPSASVSSPAAAPSSPSVQDMVSTLGSQEPSRSAERTGPIDVLSEEARLHRQAVAALVGRIVAESDLAPLGGGQPPTKSLERNVESALQDYSAVMQRDAAIPAGVDVARAVADAKAELLDLGPLRALLDDASVSEISVPSFDTVLATRGGQAIAVEPAFTSDVALGRVVARLARMAGAPMDDDASLVRCALGDGGVLHAFRARAGGGTMLRLEKSVVVTATLESLVRSGAISRAMATFLQACVTVRANFIVAGPRDASTATLLAALAAAADGSVAAFLGSQDFLGVRPGSNRLRADGSDVPRAMSVAARLPGTRLMCDAADAPALSALIDAAGHGADGIVAAVRTRSLTRALSRCAADVVASGMAPTSAAANELVATSFDIAVEIARLRDGRDRVLRIAELAPGAEGEIAHDVFTFTVERRAAGGSVEGTFHASGRVPAIVDSMIARGVPMESTLFSRPPSR